MNCYRVSTNNGMLSSLWYGGTELEAIVKACDAWRIWPDEVTATLVND